MKKLVKIVLCIAGLAAIGAGAYYYLKSKKKESISEDPSEEKKEEPVNYFDAVDLSNLKFSRHYVDLR